MYIDPPYNTGNDFIYKDNFAKSNAEADVESGNLDEEGNRMIANKLENGRYHTNWLNMIYPRLLLAKDLLSDNGVIFISIDDHEYANLKKICDEIFGEEMFWSTLIRRTRHKGGEDGINISTDHEYCLVYSKTKDVVFTRKEKSEEQRKKLYEMEDEYVKERGRFYTHSLDAPSLTYTENLDYPIVIPDGTKTIDGFDIPKGTVIYAGGVDEEGWNFRKKNHGIRDWCWPWNINRLKTGIKKKFIFFKKSKDKYRVYAKHYEFVNIDNVDEGVCIAPTNIRKTILEEYDNHQGTSLIKKMFNGDRVFDFPKPLNFIKDLISFCPNKNSVVLDFFSGSSTTAHATMQLNSDDQGKRCFIMIQCPHKINFKSSTGITFDTICDVGTERIKRAGEIIKKENPNVDTGFRYLKIDSSNINDFSINANELVQTQLENFTNSIKANRSNFDLVFEVMLSKKIPLDTKIETTKILDKTVYKVNGDYLICCFDDNLSEDFIKEVAKLSPIYLVFKETSFINDEAIKNSEELIKVFSKQKTECEII
ncbi:MAG: site-specific DNA-methyltransferase [Malacoplasma sp.]|nr:site-specific DNA-methyltransferase [Malacoplasma sp.]